MINIIRIAFRNLYRQKRRTFLTIFIISFGVIAVLLFSAVAGSFKSMMIGQITDSAIGHIQIHRSGYVQSLDNMPLNLVIESEALEKVTRILDEVPGIESYSFRILFGGMLSNYVETTNVRLAAIDPEKEKSVVPLLDGRIKTGKMLSQGEIVLPDLITKGMDLKVDSDVVIIANNADGSINGQNFKVSGIIETSLGQSGKYGYIHLEDAKTILRMWNTQISEISIRLKDLDDLESIMPVLKKKISSIKNNDGKPYLEIHPWMQLSPFYNIAQMIDMMALFIKIILITIVLISIMNVMIMAVFERVKEIGTMSAIGTPASKIKLLFTTEGLLIGIIGSIAGTIIGMVIVFIVRLLKLTVSFGRSDNILLIPYVSLSEIVFVAIIVIVISAVAVIQPAIKASRLEPIDALRQ